MPTGLAERARALENGPDLPHLVDAWRALTARGASPHALIATGADTRAALAVAKMALESARAGDSCLWSRDDEWSAWRRPSELVDISGTCPLLVSSPRPL